MHMGRALAVSAALALAVALAPAPAAAVKRVAYPEVKVEAPPPFKGDAAFDAAKKALADAVAKKDLAALSALVAPNFVATTGGEPSDQYDNTKDGLHNFKVAFGFRPFGKNADGETEIGPQWELLGDFAAEMNYAKAGDAVCGPALPVPNSSAFERATQQIEEPNQPAEWVYTLGEIALTASPGGGGTVGKAAGVALPVVGTNPPMRPGQAGPTPTHVELLLSSGKSGWVATGAVKALSSDQLCFAKQADAGWKIAGYDQAE
jgi:hypothetical protein